MIIPLIAVEIGAGSRETIELTLCTKNASR